MGEGIKIRKGEKGHFKTTMATLRITKGMARLQLLFFCYCMTYLPSYENLKKPSSRGGKRR